METEIYDSSLQSSEKSRSNLAKLIMNLFSLWNLDTKEQLSLLGLKPSSRSVLSKYRQGKSLPDNRDLLDRAEFLLSIHKSLRILYPYNEDLCYSWIRRYNKMLEERPIDLMKREGIIGFAKVSSLLKFLRNN